MEAPPDPLPQCVPVATPAGSAEVGEAVEVAQLRGNFLAELDSVALYEALAALERDTSRKAAYLQLAAVRRERAEYLEARLQSAGAPVPRIRISRRMRLFAKLLHFLSGGFVIPVFTTRVSSEHRADHLRVMHRADSEPSGPSVGRTP